MTRILPMPVAREKSPVIFIVFVIKGFRQAPLCFRHKHCTKRGTKYLLEHNHSESRRFKVTTYQSQLSLITLCYCWRQTPCSLINILITICFVTQGYLMILKALVSNGAKQQQLINLL